MTLLVADDLTSIEDIEDVVSGAFSIVLALSAVLGLIAGILLSRALLRRVNTVTHTAEAIIGGDLARRIERTGSGDDFDRLAATLNTMLDRISGLIENLHQVTNDIAHDLRTPLSRLRQTLEHTKTHADTACDYEDAIDGAIAEADGLLATFSALLRIAQIEAGARRSAFRPVDLADVIETVCEAYEPAAEEGGRSIACNSVQGLKVEGDRELLIQLFANLVENALAHTPVGTQIRINLKPQGRESSYVVAEVSDNGPGIPAHEREKVLRRFYRLEQSRTTPGNGLGLSTVRAIAELHRATLEISDNAPGLCVVIRFSPASFLLGS
jgi:signal transduction histidine kinase